MSRDPDGFPLDPDPLHVPDDPDPRVPSPWEHQRARAMERERVRGRREGCAVYVLAALFGLLVITIIVVAVAAPRAAADPTSTAPRDLSGLRAAASGGPLPGAPSPSAPEDSDTRLTTGEAGAPTSPPVALEATSEGPSGPTTPMPATP